MPDKYDVIIVGARCAGSPTAMLLARKGYRVLLVDKATFPSDTVSTHFVLHGGLRLMQKWGLLDRLLATNCPPINHYTNDIGDFALMATLANQGGVPPGMAPRRIVLDQILVEAAVEAGAELREGFAVKEVLRDGDRVTGIRGGEKGGPTVDVQAPLVIGADGKNSLLARSVDAPRYNDYPTFAFWYYSYWENVDIAGSVMCWRPRRGVGGWPTHDGRVMVGVGWPIDEYPVFREDVEGNYLKTINTMPGFGDRFRDGKMVERLIGMADIPNFFRQSYGAGWALVGDAGYFKDPIRGHGINDAFYGADILSRKIDEGLQGEKPLMQALAEYQSERDDMMMLDYEINCRAATLLDWDRPNQLELRQALKDNPEGARGYLGVVAGTVHYKDFYNSENIGRIITMAGA